MATHPLGARTSAQTLSSDSHHGLQGGHLRNPELHPFYLNQSQQRACPCKLCRRHQQASNSPPNSEVNREHPCLQPQELRVCAGASADFNEECRYGSHWPAHKASHVPAPEQFQGPCRHFDPPIVPRSPRSNGMAMGASSAHGFTPVASRFSPSSYNQERDGKQNSQGMEPNSNKLGNYGGPPNQVILYHWFLIRCEGSTQGVEVSVGGFLTLGTAGSERFKTAAIVQRIEKCRLLAHDGLEVWLAGLIDDCTTVSNGFSVDIVQTFLSGFPYTWNHILNSELCAPNPKHLDHQVSGSCGLGGGVETSQLSFEGSDPEKGAPSPSFCDHPEKVNTIKQTITAEVHSEEAATLKTNDSITRPAMESVEKLNTISSVVDQITNSNSTGLVEQEINNDGKEEGQQENAHVDQSRCKVKKRLGRPSKAHHRVESEEDGAHTQIGAGNAFLDKLNGSTETIRELVEKRDKHQQKLQITPRITRSMQKINRHMAGSRDTSVGVDTRAHCDSLSNCEEVHTPVEQCGPCVKLRSASTTPSTAYQKRADSKRSRRTLPKDIDRDNIDGGKSSNASPCFYAGAESPVEMGVRRPESLMNAEASPTSKDEHQSVQEEKFTVEVVQACDYGTTNKEESLFASVQKSKEHASFRSVEKLAKASQNDLNKRESDFLSKRSPGQGSKCMKIPPPLPQPRVSVSKRLISAAFGLKTSRSGRFLVPPLAHWCSQAVLRDKDGGIIGISEGSKDTSKDGTGYLKFMPPAEAGLRKLQKRLRKVATDRTPRKKRLGTKKRQ